MTRMDPEDAFTSVPYSKGAIFMYYLESLVGGPAEFEPFLRSYFEEYKLRSIDSFDFREHFLDFFKHNLDA